MNYTEVHIEVNPVEEGSDVLITLMADIGFDTFEPNDKGFNAYVLSELFDENALKQLFTDFKDVYNIDYSLKEIPQQNWNANWEKSFEPIAIGKSCYVRAPFHKSVDSFIYDIVIEPKMSFGTGHHDTTQLMIEKLLQLNIYGCAVLDMGCGTGVLAILASKMGAETIIAIDIDDWSIENTQENLTRNNIKNTTVYKGDAQLLHKKTFNTILANINRNVLIADMETYALSLLNGGDLLLSGFFDNDTELLINRAHALNLKLIDKKINNRWALLHFKK